MQKLILSTLLLLFTWSTVVSAANDPLLVVYSGRSESLVAPLIKKFEQKTGIKVDVRYNSTSTLATQLLHEGKNTPADVVFFQESGYLSVLAKAGLLKKLDKALLKQVEPSFYDADGYWLGSSSRLRVLAYNTQLVKKNELPKTLKDLTNPKWKGKVGWAPSNASAQAHINALRKLWGEAATKKWLEDMKANQTVSYVKNSQIVSAVAKGEILFGWVNHYYLHQLQKQDPSIPVVNYHFPAAGKAGNLVIVSGAAIVKDSPHQKAAEAFLNYLVSEDAQEYFKKENFEYSTRAAEGGKMMNDLDHKIVLAKVSQASLSDLAPTLKMLHELNLL